MVSVNKKEDISINKTGKVGRKSINPFKGLYSIALCYVPAYNEPIGRRFNVFC